MSAGLALPAAAQAANVSSAVSSDVVPSATPKLDSAADPAPTPSTSPDPTPSATPTPTSTPTEAPAVTVPAAPGLSLISASDTQIVLTLSASATDGGAKITSYAVKITGPTNPEEQVVSSPGQITFVNLSPASSYTIEATAKNSKGDSEATSLQVTTTAATEVSTPTEVTTTNTPPKTTATKVTPQETPAKADTTVKDQWPPLYLIVILISTVIALLVAGGFLIRILIQNKKIAENEKISNSTTHINF